MNEVCPNCGSKLQYQPANYFEEMENISAYWFCEHCNNIIEDKNDLIVFLEKRTLFNNIYMFVRYTNIDLSFSYPAVINEGITKISEICPFYNKWFKCNFNDIITIQEINYIKVSEDNNYYLLNDILLDSVFVTFELRNLSYIFINYYETLEEAQQSLMRLPNGL